MPTTIYLHTIIIYLCSSSFSSSLICEHGNSSWNDYQYTSKLDDRPTAQSFLNYFVLCLIFTTWLALKPGEHGLLHVLKKRGWKYFFLATIDVEANFLVVKAFQYTTLTSIQVSAFTKHTKPQKRFSKDARNIYFLISWRLKSFSLTSTSAFGCNAWIYSFRAYFWKATNVLYV